MRLQRWQQAHAHGPEAFKVIEQHNAAQAGSARDDLCVDGEAGGQAPKGPSFIPCYLRRQTSKMRKLNDAGAAALVVAHEARPQRADHAEVARFAQRLLVIGFHVPDARDAHKAGGTGAATRTRVVGKHLGDVNDGQSGRGQGRVAVVVIALGQNSLGVRGGGCR